MPEDPERRTDMPNEASVIQSLAEMADTLVSDFDVVELLTGLAGRCVTLLGMSAAGVVLASPEGDLRLVASSSEAMRVLEVFELQAQEGPCLDAFDTAERVGPEDLRAAAGRWPRLAPVAIDAGFDWVAALPLRLRETTIGALNLFSAGTDPPDDAAMVVTRAFADLAAISILQHRAIAEYQRITDQLSQALRSRVVIEQAKGVIAERAGVDLDEAFRRLRLHARTNNLRLTDVARSAVEGTLDAAAWETPAEKPARRRGRRQPLA
jgi:GAF domain-containing protein